MQKQDLAKARRFSVAPMMDWTDRHCRYLHRLLTQNALLFTEMVTSPAIIHGDRDRLLGFDAVEHPVALQIGGSDPDELAEAARIGADYGYDEINLNVGCPSDRVQSGMFGACLMAEPDLVARCVEAMAKTVSVPVTVKCRIGIDDQDIEAPLDHFADLQRNAGSEVLYVHARKAWLQGLSPKENRDIPPLDYDRVYRLARRLAPYEIFINGGIPDLDAVETHLEHVSGAMLGRAAYHTPMLMAEVDRRLYGAEAPDPTLAEVMVAMQDYAEKQVAHGVRLNHVTRHMIGLATGLPGARRFRQILSVEACKPDASAAIIAEALAALERSADDYSRNSNLSLVTE